MTDPDSEQIKLALRTSTVTTILEILGELDTKFQTRARNSSIAQKVKHEAQAAKYLVMKMEIEGQLTPGKDSNGTADSYGSNGPVVGPVLVRRALGELSKPI
jgi:hypothetical protein